MLRESTISLVGFLPSDAPWHPTTKLLPDDGMRWDGVISWMEGGDSVYHHLNHHGAASTVLCFTVLYCTVPYLAVDCHLD